jgi:dihydropteroate synthase
MQLRLGKRVLTLDRSRIMAVLNTTPDSFSDGGRFLDSDEAIRHAESMSEQGADIIDVGGESTRPGAKKVSVEEEIERTIPVVEKICSNLDVIVSIDTSKPEVMRAAVAAGATLINDVFALRRDEALATAAELQVAVCLVHMLGQPQTMQEQPSYDNLPGDVIDFLQQRVATCLQAGIAGDRIIIDPGFGFGKNDQHNLQILARLSQFSDLGLPILVGLSRKQTLGNLTGQKHRDRVMAGAVAAAIAVCQGAHIVRTHDVAATAEALRIADAVRQAGQDE